MDTLAEYEWNDSTLEFQFQSLVRNHSTNRQDLYLGQAAFIFLAWFSWDLHNWHNFTTA